MSENSLAILSKGKRPAYLAKTADKAKAFNDFFTAGNTYNGLPKLGIGGKAFAMQLGDKTIVAKNSEGDTMSSMLVVLGAARAAKMSKSYYVEEFSEGSDAKSPDCFSDDGVTPAASARTPQCASCSVCAHNQFGSARMGEGKACRDYKRLVVVPYTKEHGLLIDPEREVPQGLYLNVPVKSHKSLAAYIKDLSDAGIPANAVVTKIKFVAEAKHPQLEFSGAGWLTEEQHAAIEDLAANDEKWLSSIDIAPAYEGVVEASAATAARTPAASKPATKQKAAPDVDSEDADDDAVEVATPATKTKTAKPEAPAKKAKAAAPKKSASDDDDDAPALGGKSDDDLLAELDDWGNGDDDE